MSDKREKQRQILAGLRKAKAGQRKCNEQRVKEGKAEVSVCQYKSSLEKAEEKEVRAQDPKSLTDVLGGFKIPKKSGISKESQGHDIYKERREEQTGIKRKSSEPQTKEVKRLCRDQGIATPSRATKPSSTKSELATPASNSQGKSMTREQQAAATNTAKAIAARLSAGIAKNSLAAKETAPQPKAKSSASPAGEKRKRLDEQEGAVKKVKAEHVVDQQTQAPVTTATINKAETINAKQASDQSATKPEPAKPAQQEKLGAQDSKSVGAGKRKAEESLEAANKRVKAPTSMPSSLVNNKHACYINASLHLLHSVPAFAAMGATAPANLSANSALSPDEFKIVNTTRQTRRGRESLGRLERHLDDEKASNNLKLSSYLAGQMRHLSQTGDRSKGANTYAFHQVCGALLVIGNEEPMSGETQEDAHEFLTKLMQQLTDEEPNAPPTPLFDAEFAERKVCECGNQKTFVDKTSTFPIPGKYHSTDKAIAMKAVVEDFVSSESGKFDQYQCDRCMTSGKWSAKDGGWAGQRLTNSPDFLLAHANRSLLTNKGQEKKIQTKLTPPTRKISLPCANGSSVKYNMIAMIQHHGTSADEGHYTAVRKVDGQWYHCDDTSRGGVTEMTRGEVEKEEMGTLFLLRKVD